MYDRPTAHELLDAVRAHLEDQVIPAVRNDRKLYFQTLVAANVLRIVGREMQLAPAHGAEEWARLGQIDGSDAPPPPDLAALQAALNERGAALAAAIRAGDYDDDARRHALFAHLTKSVIEQLEVANPAFLQKLAAEDADPTRDAWAGREQA